MAVVGAAIASFIASMALVLVGAAVDSSFLVAVGAVAGVAGVGLCLLVTVRYARSAAAKASAAEMLARRAVCRTDGMRSELQQAVGELRSQLRSDIKSDVKQELARVLVTHRHDTIRDLAALHTLHDMVDVAGEHVPLTSWAALPATVLALVQQVRDLPPAAVVVELGSGASTVWMALEAKRRGDGIRIISFDHDADFAKVTQRALERNGVDDIVELRVAPLEPMQTVHGEQLWYAPEHWESLADVALVFVDGPPGITGPLARYPAVEALADKLAPGAVVVLDDTNRPDEQEALAGWLRLHSESGQAAVVEDRERTSIIRVP